MLTQAERLALEHWSWRVYKVSGLFLYLFMFKAREMSKSPTSSNQGVFHGQSWTWPCCLHHSGASMLFALFGPTQLLPPYTHSSILCAHTIRT